jgi:hypothetical protein
MKHVKMLGLVAVAAMAFMAFVGASSASAADRLCETNTTPCTSPVATNGVINAEAKDPILTGSTELTCEKSTVSAKITKNDGTVAPTGEITALSWTNCKDLTHGVGCTVTTNNLPYHAEVTTPGPNLTVKPGPSGVTPRATAVCAGFINCTFTNTDFTLPIDVGSPASVTAVAVKLSNTGGFLCPAEAFWDAKYVAESPTSSIFVSAS